MSPTKGFAVDGGYLQLAKRIEQRPQKGATPRANVEHLGTYALEMARLERTAADGADCETPC